MERADFIHLVRLSEHASADDSDAYRRSVAPFAALGYLWVLGCLVLAAALLAWALGAMAHGRIRGYHIALVITGAGLLWTSLRALWFRLEPPTGTPLPPSDAPGLLEALERIRKKIKGPKIDHVLIDGSFNASISQIPRWGLFGGATNYLTIGLPLLMALDRPRFLSVMAHEYGHLRGGHGQFAAWIYRTRQSWMKLEHGLRYDSGVLAAATQAFLRWYFPRFLAKTFALARQDDFGAMRTLLAQPVDAEFAREALRQALIQLSDEDDTHPVLRDRLEALKVAKQLPAWSTRPALELLGESTYRWLTHFDQQWCRDNATDWKAHHAYLRRVQVGIDTLTASLRRNNADEMTQLGDLQRRPPLVGLPHRRAPAGGPCGARRGRRKRPQTLARTPERCRRGRKPRLG